MITDAMLRIISTLLGWILSLLPSWQVSLPAPVTSAIGFLRGFDAYLPVTEVLTCVSLSVGCMLAYQAVKWTIKIVDWIADVLP